MTITLTIDDRTDAIENWTESEITQAITRRRRDGLNPCVRVNIKAACAEIALATRSCGHTFAGGRPPNRCEQDIIDLWEKLHLGEQMFAPGNVVAFGKQTRRLLESH